jgi:lipopolysaccharide/colanic/teichoic acid biosynthesis glycosyltransferase
LLPRFTVLTSVAFLAPIDAAVSVLARRGQHREGEAERVLAIVGDAEAASLAAELERSPERRALLVASCLPADAIGAPGARPLAALVTERRASLVVLDRLAQSDDAIVAQVAELHRAGVRVRTLSLFYDEWLGKLPVGELERVSLLFDIHELHRPIYPRVKRSIDVAVAVPGVLLYLFAGPFVALVDLVANPGPLLYRQERVGKDGVEFTILKFRTMRPDAGRSGDSRWTEDDDQRLGPWGRFMRSSHLDELPQFVNVLRRDLSVIGPRPEQPRYVAELSEKIPYYELRHLVRPGVTGWAQVKYGYGGSELDALEKLQYEFYYLRHQGFLLDVRIIARTLRSIAGRTGR